MNEKWKFEPDPITRSYINYLDNAPVVFDELKRQIELIRKDAEEKFKNYHLVSDYKEQLTYLFELLKDYDFCQEMPLIDVTGDKEKGIIYINLYRNDFSKNYDKQKTTESNSRKVE